MTNEEFSEHFKKDPLLLNVKTEIADAQRELVELFAKAISRTIELVGVETTDIQRIAPMVLAVVQCNDEEITLRVLQKVVPDCETRLKATILDMILSDVFSDSDSDSESTDKVDSSSTKSEKLH